MPCSTRITLSGRPLSDAHAVTAALELVAVNQLNLQCEDAGKQVAIEALLVHRVSSVSIDCESGVSLTIDVVGFDLLPSYNVADVTRGPITQSSSRN